MKTFAKVIGWFLAANLLPMICVLASVFDPEDQVKFPHWYIPYFAGYAFDLFVVVATALVYLAIYLINGCEHR